MVLVHYGHILMIKIAREVKKAENCDKKLPFLVIFPHLKLPRGVTKPRFQLVLDILSWHAKFQGIPVVWKAMRAVSMIFSHLGAKIELQFINSLTRDFIL